MNGKPIDNKWIVFDPIKLEFIVATKDLKLDGTYQIKVVGMLLSSGNT